MFEGPDDTRVGFRLEHPARRAAQRNDHGVTVRHAVRRPPGQPFDAGRCGGLATVVLGDHVVDQAPRMRVGERGRQPDIQPQFAAVGHLAEGIAATADAGESERRRQPESAVGQVHLRRRSDLQHARQVERAIVAFNLRLPRSAQWAASPCTTMRARR